ncbi:YheC/YheD family protein [Alicyclobacillus vulcanalis]|uniref:Glutathione synthase/RimK-type ligase, ATP-grasp superfamily n=1 Tax=Alicyclobacillus vulcanalis TaxID=252246 RepID=A0A1N7MTC0_9BACL|nr:YheC/YheD family protein [Alicyclobacillus vulcanalis]SIS89373.1 Glutathione synthase/RimK-type ligase, ATP-grasp superfamily [Alicyclobacillus vulcanalis]
MEGEGLPASLTLYVDGPYRAARRFGEQTRMFEDLTELGRERGVDVRVLTPGDWSARRAHAFSGQRWITVPCAHPGVVLRRSGVFQRQPEIAARELVALRRRGLVHTLPRRSGHKWKLYTWLRKDARLKPHLPLTWFCATVDDLVALLQDQDDLYVKPVNGTQGQGIFRVRTHRGAIEVSTASGDAPASFVSLAAFRQAFSGGHWVPSVAQKTIPLARLGARPFDLRWLVCDGNRPHIVARVARLGPPGAVTTNIHTGSEPRAAAQVFADAFGSKRADDLVERMDEIALLVARRARERFGPYAELGVDLAASEDGHVFFLEFNPTPGRKMLRQLDPKLHRLSLEALLEYAIEVQQPRGG